MKIKSAITALSAASLQIALANLVKVAQTDKTVLVDLDLVLRNWRSLRDSGEVFLTPEQEGALVRALSRLTMELQQLLVELPDVSKIVSAHRQSMAPVAAPPKPENLKTHVRKPRTALQAAVPTDAGVGSETRH